MEYDTDCLVEEEMVLDCESVQSIGSVESARPASTLSRVSGFTLILVWKTLHLSCQNAECIFNNSPRPTVTMIISIYLGCGGCSRVGSHDMPLQWKCFISNDDIRHRPKSIIAPSTQSLAEEFKS
ncbi:hypothetical protein PoB_007354100 [Plakobranchus ocellatus]|uniref:Uncharacterized protein n=1 Tax=Plakobranchus ocellatus TaxID=259542 RepID=A0AAV4DT22_9GAST|nr:hypothetical protein PoB_007354100 [Plakobranchus ocellatus]